MEKGWLSRKLQAAFFATSMLSIYLSADYTIAIREQYLYELGTHFLSWLMIYFVYSGVVILIYGSLVSIFIEWVDRTFIQMAGWIYVLIHGLFGLPFGLISSFNGAVIGGAAALTYGLIDYFIRKKRPRFFTLPSIPLIVAVAIAFILTGLSPEQPPFTRQDAIVEAHAARDVEYDHFPKEEGTWTSVINGYDVQQEVTVNEIDNEVYIVTFRETWEKGLDQGEWNWSYEVSRGAVASKGGREQTPGYYQ
ncbi:hypothetical protein [Alkalicoccobacillus porphyridii]|uniref:Uncharacterized protein n=1 Tax=Alkalicoccobacillus porphyridii TaxID=2597270 RepID=A0A554A0Y2_9BACI|nr:hypothetical protein [Alkalicoccobacillus porphyridii]TSB47349.1 hypothetical protein FN960_06315 [Alkalicoccobacillus porphyridii]